MILFDHYKMHRRPARGIGGFFRHSMAQARRFGMGVDNFMRANGNRIRDVAATIAPLLAPENPALAAGVATIGQGAASYGQLRDALDRAG